MLTKKFISPGLLASLVLLQACAPTLPAFKKKNMEVPKNFPKENASKNSKSTAEVTWEDFFKDQDLQKLISIALKNNQELKILEQEINIANNEIMARKGEYWPKFWATADGGVEKVERFSTEDANSRTRFGRAGVMTSWELDIWGKLRNATKSAYFTYLSSIEGKRYVVTNLIAEVATTYFELMALDNQLKIVDSYVDVLTQIRDMVDLQQRAGRVTSLAVKRFQAEVFKNQSRKFSLEQQVNITQNRLNVLVGRFPQKIERDSDTFQDYKFSKLQTSVPTKLLENRPDIKKASYELEAAKIDVDVARKRFYPALSIEGGYGYEQFNSKHFDGTPTSLFYGIAANITAPLLNRQAIKADYYSANNKQIQAIYNYEKNLIQGYTEVANQLTMLNNLTKVYDLKKKQVKALNKSIEISNTLFKAARVDYIEALFTQRDSLEAQIDLIDVKKDQLAATVNLYKALGGGWKGLKEESESNY